MVKINLRYKFNKYVEKIVDLMYGKPADIITAISYVLIFIGIIISTINTIRIAKNPLMDTVNPNILAVLIILCIISFFFSQLSKYFQSPSKRIWQYLFIIIGISAFSLNYLSYTFNTLFVNILSKIKNIEVIPPDLLLGNIRVVTILVPAAIILPVLYTSLGTIKDNKSKELIRSFEIDALLPTVHKSDDATIDIEICKDYKTGMPCIVPEKIWFEHAWVQGGSGSGKTSSFIIPFEEQLLRQKSYLNYNLKVIALSCLKSGIARVNKPISNKWFNENFNLDLIEPVHGKEDEFYKAFSNYSLGSIKKDEIIYESKFEDTTSLKLSGLKSKDYYYECKIKVFKNNLIHDEINFKIEKSNENIVLKYPYLEVESTIQVDDKLNVKLNNDSNTVTNELVEGINSIQINIVTNEHKNKSAFDEINNKANNNMNESSNGDISNSTNEEINKMLYEQMHKNTNNGMSYQIVVSLKGNGRLVPKNLGLTVVAPDGDLPNTTVKLGAEYGIKVHKIDPYIEEIKKGNVAKFNPLKGDSPEKIGDIVASILVSMDSSNSQSNPYFTNASVRAVRNLVILLKISYPHLYHRDPTLEDVLFCLNNFNHVKEPVTYVKNDFPLLKQWRSVIDYFDTSFLDAPQDPNSQNASSSIGSQKKETQRAIGGIINQLDNLLGRKEIRYILCSEEDSLDLAEVLRNGECIAISTRQGHLGARLGKAFALFFILTLQNEVLSRYAENENPEIPHYLIIDEFPMYCNENTETFFSFARKYKCSVTIAIQDMAQLKKVSDEFGETLFTNTTTKLLLPKSNLEDRKYWSEYFGTTTEMEMMTGISTSSMFADNPSYSESIRGAMGEVKKVSEEDVDSLNFQQLYYSYTNNKGRKVIGKGTTSFMKTKHESYMDKVFDFEQYGMTEKEFSKVNAIKEKEEIKQQENEEINKIRSVNNSTALNGKFTITKKEEIPLENIKEESTLLTLNENTVEIEEEKLEKDIIDNTPEETTDNDTLADNIILNYEIINNEDGIIESKELPRFVIKGKNNGVKSINSINIDDLLLVDSTKEKDNDLILQEEIQEHKDIAKKETTIYNLFD